MTHGPYIASKDAPAHRQACNCGRPVARDGRTFPHRWTLDCERYLDDIEQMYEITAHERDALDESRAANAREITHNTNRGY